MRILDFHCHVYPTAIAERAAESVARFYHVHRGTEIAALHGTFDEMLSHQKAAGIAKTLLCSAATVPHQVQHINEFLARCARESDGQCLSFGTLHPDSPDVAGDIAHLLDLGLQGVKFHPDMQGFAMNAPKTMRLLEIADGRLMFLIHTGDKRYRNANPEQMQEVLAAFPNTTFIGAHMCGHMMWQEGTAQMAGKYENLYVDMSSTLFGVTPEVCVEMIRAYGADRVLFGTDYPMWDPVDEVRRFLTLPLTQQERQRIAWDNAARLLGL